MSEKPTGFVARCRCGNYVAAVDSMRMPASDAVPMLVEWLLRGDTVEPRFGDWSVDINKCRCVQISGEAGL